LLSIFIPDIHGFLVQMKRLVDELVRLGYLADHQLVFLGDYVDRGPDTKGVIDFCIELQKSGHIFICGNHDYLFHQIISKQDPADRFLDDWIFSFTGMTMKSFGLNRFGYRSPSELGLALRAAMSQEEIDFIATLPLYYETGNFIAIHGRCLTSSTWEHQKRELDSWDRLRKYTPDQLAFTNAWGLPLGFDGCVVSGHQIMDEPQISPHRVRLELGLDETGVLVAWIPDQHKLVFANKTETWTTDETP